MQAAPEPFDAPEGTEPLDPWALPEGIEVSEDVDLDSDDPALGDDGRRRCVATSQAGTRCRATPAREHVLCNAHAGIPRRQAGVPICNYGMTIAYTLGIFDRALEPFPDALETYRELTAGR